MPGLALRTLAAASRQLSRSTLGSLTCTCQTQPLQPNQCADVMSGLLQSGCTEVLLQLAHSEAQLQECQRFEWRHQPIFQWSNNLRSPKHCPVHCKVPQLCGCGRRWRDCVVIQQAWVVEDEFG